MINCFGLYKGFERLLERFNVGFEISMAALQKVENKFEWLTKGKLSKIQPLFIRPKRRNSRTP